MKKKIILVVLLFLLSGTFLFYQFLQIDENFCIIETYTGDVPEYDQIMEVVDNFDYAAELNLSSNDFSHKIANYCSASVFDHFTAVVKENKAKLWWKPYTHSKLRYEVNVAFLDSFNITYIESRQFHIEITITFNSEILDLNEIHGWYLGNRFTIEDPHWYMNESYHPGFFVNPIDIDVESFIGEKITFSDIFLISIDMRYFIATGFRMSGHYTIRQLVAMNADLDIIAVLVFDMMLAVA